jgi:hypothetical protein
MPRIAKMVMFSENCSAVSIKLRRGARAVALTSMKISLGPFTSLRLRPPEAHLTLNELHIPFVNHAKTLDVIFD